MSPFIRAIVQYARSGEAAEAEVRAEFANLYAKQVAGDGKSLVTATVNGKQVGWKAEMSAEEKFAAYGQALSILDGRVTRRTVAAIY